MNNFLYDVILSPKVTESSVTGEENIKRKQYIFVVNNKANKPLVKKAVEKIFNTKVFQVNILNQKGKIKKVKGIIGKRKNVKKAIVSLNEGETIDIVGKIY